MYFLFDMFDLLGWTQPAQAFQTHATRGSNLKGLNPVIISVFIYLFSNVQKYTSALICGKKSFSWFNIIGSQEEASADVNVPFKGALCSFGEEEMKTDNLCPTN